MTVHSGSASLNGTGNVSAFARQQHVNVSAVLSGAGSLSTYAGDRIFATARFAGSGSLSADETIIQAECSILVTSLMQAIADRSIAEIVGDPKRRLVVAVEISILPIG